MPAQDRLLRAIEYGEITRIGASKPISVDVRIVAATNENLPAQVDKGKFRADLLDRLSFEVITLPPLRAREGDVPLLADHFGRRMAAELDWSNWPGFTRAGGRRARSLSLARQRSRAEKRDRTRRLSARGPRAGDRRDQLQPVPLALGADSDRRAAAPRGGVTEAAEEPAPHARLSRPQPPPTSDFRARGRRL